MYISPVMYRGILRLLLCACAALPARAQLTLAAAASVQPALDEARALFAGSAGIETRAVYGSSGKLAAQIRNGAPFDLFLSADTAFPESLSAWGRASGRPAVYAYGRLALWTAKDLDLGPGLSALAGSGVRTVAVADPALAPYGREAVQALRRAGAYASVKGKLVFGESVAQVNQYVLLGAADVGITALASVRAPEARGKGRWVEVDSAAYAPIAQAAVATAYGAAHHREEAARFLGFLASPPARAVLSAYGYRVP
jgi:molybdate transport system substrate-binding protein